MTRPPLTEDVPCLSVEGGEARHLVATAIHHLTRANDPPQMFVRGGHLARVRVDENARPLIEAFDRPAMDAALRVELEARMDFGRMVSKRGEPDPVWKSMASAPRDIVSGVRTEGEWRFVPPLEAIVESPTMRADGEIVDEPGYDPESRLLYQPAPDLQVGAVPRDPTGDQVAAAVAALDDVLCDFPFATATSRANALALLLTPLVRPAIAGPVPLALVSGTKAGTGKGLLIEVASRIATGRSPGLTPVSASEEEMGKVIGSLLLAGATFVAFDEADELRSPSLALALTASVVKPRILGQSLMAELPQRATWVAAGNNITLRGDLVRRCYWIELDAKVARPYERTGFRHPELIAHVTARRGELLAAALTIARAWWATGRPAADVPTLGGFENWAKTLGGILAHAGIDGFLADQHAKHREADTDSGEWEAFLAALRELYRGEPFTVGDVLTAIGNGHAPGLLDSLPDDLAEQIQGAAAASARSRLGKALRKRNGTRYGDEGLHLAVAAGPTKNTGARWAIHTDNTDDGVVGVVGEVFNLPTHVRGRGRTHVKGAGNHPEPPDHPTAVANHGGEDHA